MAGQYLIDVIREPKIQILWDWENSTDILVGSLELKAFRTINKSRVCAVTVRKSSSDVSGESQMMQTLQQMTDKILTYFRCRRVLIQAFKPCNLEMKNFA